MPFTLRERFITALERAKTKSDLSPGFRSYLNNGYKPDKVMPTSEQSLKGAVIEWEN